MIYPIVPSGWTRESGYPKITRSDGQFGAIDKLFVSMTSFDPSQLAQFDAYNYLGLVGNAQSAEPNAAGDRMHVTVTYTKPTATGNSPNLSATEYSLENAAQEIPIARVKADGTTFYLSNYRVNWHYFLVAEGANATVPSWWSTSQTLVAPAPYRWIRNVDSKTATEYVLKNPTMSQETYLAPAPVVVEKRRYSSYSAAVANVPRPGTKHTPGATFGYTGQWLIISAPLRPDGKRWETEIRYQLADEWDSRVYQEA